MRRPDIFPAVLHRSEQPDFVVTPRRSDVRWWIEHTDAGEQEYQEWLARTEVCREPLMMPSPDGRGWHGDEAERAFAEQIAHAVRRKAEYKFWHEAPSGTSRCVLLYDQTNSRLFVEDADAGAALNLALVAAAHVGSLDAAMLVRGRNRVLFAGRSI